jgi:hypothetical protein
MKKSLPGIFAVLLTLTACEKVDLQLNPKGFTSGRCLNTVGKGPSATSPYQNRVWADEFNGPEPGEDLGCYSRTPECALRLDWPGHGDRCSSAASHPGLRDLNKCNWKLWDGFSFWGEWPKGGKFSYKPSQVSVHGGAVHFTIARRNPQAGALCGKHAGSDPNSGAYYGTDCEWISGGIDSSHAGGIPGRNIKNGRIEMRAKLPSGVGVYPALWTWVTPKGRGIPYQNPSQMSFSGEYDLLEAVTKSSGRIQAFQTYHDWGYSPDSHTQSGSGTEYLDPGVWYRFGVERYQDKIRYYIDDCYTHEVTVGDRGVRINDLAQYLIMNLAMENEVINTGRAGPLDGKTLDVDYVRLYE